VTSRAHAPRLGLGSSDYEHVAQWLRPTDKLLARAYPGDDGSRQPVHTVYVPANTFTPNLPLEWGQQALAAVQGQDGLERLASRLGLGEPDVLAGLVARKLSTEPVEDLRLDFEDG